MTPVPCRRVPSPQSPGVPFSMTLVSPKELQARYIDSRLVDRRCLDIGDDQRSPVGATEGHIGDLGTGDWDLLDHLTRWIEDGDSAPAIVGDVEVAGFVERHAIGTFATGEEGEILTRTDSAIRLDRVAQDAVVVGLGQVDGSAIGAQGDAIGKGQTSVDPLQTTIRKESVEPADGVFGR